MRILHDLLFWTFLIIILSKLSVSLCQHSWPEVTLIALDSRDPGPTPLQCWPTTTLFCCSTPSGLFENGMVPSSTRIPVVNWWCFLAILLFSMILKWRSGSRSTPRMKRSSRPISPRLGLSSRKMASKLSLSLGTSFGRRVKFMDFISFSMISTHCTLTAQTVRCTKPGTSLWKQTWSSPIQLWSWNPLPQSPGVSIMNLVTASNLLFGCF